MVRILLADDYAIVRHGLRDMITRHPGWEVCGEARDGREAVAMAAALTPDVAFVHVDRADRDGRGWVTSPLTDVLAVAQAARRTVLVAEKIGSGDGPATIPALLVDAVVHAPGAVRPDGAAGRYGRDLTAYAVYSTVAGTPEGRAAWRTSLSPDRGSD